MGNTTNISRFEFAATKPWLLNENVTVGKQKIAIVKQVAEERKYDFIFDRSSSATMLYSAKNYDISDLVIKRINRQQKIQERQNQIEALKSKASTKQN